MQLELEALQHELAASTSVEHDAFESLAKTECTQLCNRVMIHLPREIRDMIYRHLSTSSEERISREYFRSTLDPVTKLHTYDAGRWKAKHHPEHYWDVEYVGDDFFRELAENHFRTSTFMFGDDSGLIQRFLWTDQMQAGFPPKELVSRIEVHLNAMTFDRTCCIGYMFGCAVKPERLQTAVKGSERLKPGASVVVQFATQAKDEKKKKEQIMTACTALIPSLRELKVAGYKVGLMIDKAVEVELDDDSGDYQLKQLREAEDFVVR